MNYPEHKFIWPRRAAGAMGVLSFTMVNNGVHWASDYPLALAIGGVVGKVVATRGRTVGAGRRHQPADAVRAGPAVRASRFTPMIGPGVVGVRATW